MNKHAGFTLVELMVAIVIGVFLIASMMNLFITMNRSVTLSDALSQNQETGRFAMDYLTRFTRQAGYTDDTTAEVDPFFTSPECDATPEACSENNPDDINGDRLAIQYYVSSGDSRRACSGTLVNGPTKVADVFWVSADAGSEGELRCRAFNTSTGAWIDANPVSLVNNLELLEVQIGVANKSQDRQASRYVNLDTFNQEVNNLSLSVESIRSIKLAILTTSTNSDQPGMVQSDVKERKYVVLDSPILTFNDGTLRSIFSSTVELPNAIESAYLKSAY